MSGIGGKHWRDTETGWLAEAVRLLETVLTADVEGNPMTGVLGFVRGFCREYREMFKANPVVAAEDEDPVPPWGPAPTGAAIRDLDGRLEAADNRLDALDGQLSALTNPLATRIERLESDVGDVVQRFDGLISHHAERIVGLESKAAVLDRDARTMIDALKVDVDALGDRVREDHARHANHAEGLIDLDRRTSYLETADALEARAPALAARIEAVESALNDRMDNHNRRLGVLEFPDTLTAPDDSHPGNQVPPARACEPCPETAERVVPVYDPVPIPNGTYLAKFNGARVRVMEGPDTLTHPPSGDFPSGRAYLVRRIDPGPGVIRTVEIIPAEVLEGPSWARVDPPSTGSVRVTSGA